MTVYFLIDDLEFLIEHSNSPNLKFSRHRVVKPWLNHTVPPYVFSFLTRGHMHTHRQTDVRRSWSKQVRSATVLRCSQLGDLGCRNIMCLWVWWRKLDVRKIVTNKREKGFFCCSESFYNINSQTVYYFARFSRYFKQFLITDSQ